MPQRGYINAKISPTVVGSYVSDGNYSTSIKKGKVGMPTSQLNYF